MAGSKPFTSENVDKPHDTDGSIAQSMPAAWAFFCSSSLSRSRRRAASASFNWPSHSTRNSSPPQRNRSEEHTSELQSRQYLVCRLLLEKKKKKDKKIYTIL